MAKTHPNANLPRRAFINDYTQKARQSMNQTGVEFNKPMLAARGAYAQFDVGRNTATFSDKPVPEDTYRHEMGHKFDWEYGVTGYNDYNPDLPNTDVWYNRGQYGRPVQSQFAAQYPGVNPGALRESPFLAYSLGEQPELHKEMAQNPNGWWNRGELYARMNEDPSKIPLRMRMFFPQYEASAFNSNGAGVAKGISGPEDPVQPLAEYGYGDDLKHRTIRQTGWGGLGSGGRFSKTIPAEMDNARTNEFNNRYMQGPDDEEPGKYFDYPGREFNGRPENYIKGRSMQDGTTTQNTPPRTAPRGWTWKQIQDIDGTPDWQLVRKNAR